MTQPDALRTGRLRIRSEPSVRRGGASWGWGGGELDSIWADGFPVEKTYYARPPDASLGDCGHHRSPANFLERDSGPESWDGTPGVKTRL